MSAFASSKMQDLERNQPDVQRQGSLLDALGDNVWDRPTPTSAIRQGSLLDLFDDGPGNAGTSAKTNLNVEQSLAHQQIDDLADKLATIKAQAVQAPSLAGGHPQISIHEVAKRAAELNLQATQKQIAPTESVYRKELRLVLKCGLFGLFLAAILSVLIGFGFSEPPVINRKLFAAVGGILGALMGVAYLGLSPIREFLLKRELRRKSADNSQSLYSSWDKRD